MDPTPYRHLFVEEARRRLGEAARAVDVLREIGAADVTGPVSDAFRNVHTLKGMSATMQYPSVTLLSHALEDLCDALRTGNLTPTESTLARLDDGLERLGTMIDVVAEGGDPEPASDLEEAIRGHLRHEGVTGFNLIEPATEPVLIEPTPPSPREEDALGALTELMAVAQHLRAIDDDARPLGSDIARLERATRRIFASLSRLRQVSFETLLPALRRHLRAVCAASGREATMEVYGEQTLVDPTVLAHLQGTFSQFVSNAVLHGIEPAAERRRRGKARAGQILLVVEREGDDLVVNFSDDGRGFDVARLAALEAGELDRTEVGGAPPPRTRRRSRPPVSEQEMERAVNIAMKDGVSTLTGVFEHGGRGHGMGAIRQIIDELGGTLSIESTAERGTRFRIVVPVQQRFEELVLVEEDGVTFALPARTVAPGASRSPLPLRAGGSRRVDRVLGTVEGLVSPPPFPFNLLPQVNGTTVGPDGTILFVLDPSPDPAGARP